jgi:threonine/homoserine/homoserine lactone efflux protein
MLDHIVQVLPQFLLACLVLAAIPGPATMLCLHRTLRDGRAAGLAAVAGNEIGVFGWALAGGAGLSVLITANRLLFDALHVVGGLALVALGVLAWRDARRAGADAPALEGPARLPRGRSPGAAFGASLLSIAANPKAAVFAISFLPQFLPRGGGVVPTLIALACIQVMVDAAWTGGLVLLAGRVRRRSNRVVARQRVERALGATLIALGLELAVDRRQ